MEYRGRTAAFCAVLSRRLKTNRADEEFTGDVCFIWIKEPQMFALALYPEERGEI